MTFFDFYEIYVGYKSFHLWVNCRNFYPKISLLKSLEQTAKNGRKTRFENDQIWKLCKFRCNGRKFTIYGAKDIYYFQRYQWRYFWIEISTIYPQMKTFASYVNFIKIEKSQNSRNYIWDEFLPGWVLTLNNGKIECCRWFWDQFLTS